jgi:hypothetical protein
MYVCIHIYYIDWRIISSCIHIYKHIYIYMIVIYNIYIYIYIYYMYRSINSSCMHACTHIYIYVHI